MCKLKKYFYGLKQSLVLDFRHLPSLLEKKKGYSQGQSHYPIFVKHIDSGKMAFLIVYIENIILLEVMVMR